jgi:hypothetical protein
MSKPPKPAHAAGDARFVRGNLNVSHLSAGEARRQCVTGFVDDGHEQLERVEDDADVGQVPANQTEDEEHQ